MSSTTSNSSDSTTKIWRERVTDDEDLKRLAILDDGQEILEIQWDEKNSTMCISFVNEDEDEEKSPMEKLKELMHRNPDALERILSILKAE